MTVASENFDVVILGGGPGGYVAAIRAAQLGMSTALVEREHLGGICLNWGCIPTKALLRSAEVMRLMNHAGNFGLTVEGAGYDAARVVARSRAIADRLSKGVAHLLAKNRVKVFSGEGRLAGRSRVVVAAEDREIAELTSRHVVLATGARARELPGVEADGKAVWTYRDAMVPDEIPSSVLVVGSGAIGVEFASFYRDMGADVTIVEAMDRILPAEDEEISAFARKSFEGQGIAITTGAKVKGATNAATGVKGRDRRRRRTDPYDRRRARGRRRRHCR